MTMNRSMKNNFIYESNTETAGLIKGYDVYARLVGGILEAACPAKHAISSR